MSDAIRIAVVDDHTLFRRGLVALLSQEPAFEIVGQAADGIEGVKLAANTRPDVLLLDNDMPGISGIEAIASIREVSPDTRVLMLTVSEAPEHLLAALRAGASGYLLKNIESDFLVNAVKAAAAGESTISKEMTAALVDHVRAAQPAPAPSESAGLSPREREIVGHLASGESNKEIARALDIAESTVKIHVQNVLKKLKVASRVQVAVWATEHGIAAPTATTPAAASAHSRSSL